MATLYIRKALSSHFICRQCHLSFCGNLLRVEYVYLGFQVDILKFLRESSYWQRSSGRDHVVPMHHPNAFRFLREEVNTSILVVADFGRYPKTMANLTKDIVAPYVHVVDSFIDDDPPDPYQSRTTLLFFRGRTLRKDVR